ncbi:MAG TPA: undecaprenyl-phosphate galactose phosphotransferase WbaP [Rubrobacter sp.]|jgi:Undecaprenyl-phosphate galactose phosphotransferase WbaP|nr:undecaprenyl-phosphate galactose phosphotransferase WbaP [Rubrobacter sp.]
MEQRLQQPEILQQPEETLVPCNYEGSGIGKTQRWRQAWRQRLVVATLVLSDLVLALSVWGVASLLQGEWGRGPLSVVAVASVVPVVAVWLGLRALLGLYPGYGLDSVETLRRHTYAVFATVAMLAVFALGFKTGGSLSRLLLFFFFLSLLVLAPLAQHLVKRGLKKAGLWGKPVMIFGSGQNEGRVRRNVARLLQEKWDLGYNPVAVLNCQLPRLAPTHPTRFARPQEGSPGLQILANAADLAHRQGVDTAIFAMPHTRREQVAEIVGVASIRFRHVLIIPNLNGVTNSAVVARDLAGTLAVEIKYNLLNPWALRAKRIADVVSTAIGGVLILPLILVLALLVFAESGGPIFYKDRRMGRDGSLFSCVKFSTMVPDAEALLQRMIETEPELREEYSRYHKLRDDPRVTRVGRFLRKTSLDELPQLWNVLRGEMSLVGPRPYLPRESKEIGITQSEILRVPPGITGPWQVTGRNQASFDERVQMDACYVRDWSVWLDLVLLARTTKTVVLGKGAY